MLYKVGTQLCLQKVLLSFEPRLFKPSPHLCLIAVAVGRVNEAVAAIQGKCHVFRNLAAGLADGAKAQLRHFDAVV